MARFFRFPFGLSGDRVAIPDPAQPGGEVSFNQGFGPDYEIAPGDPGWKPVPRPETNGLYYDLTDNVRQYQLFGVPEWVDASQNAGAAVSYAIAARVRHNDIVYVSLIATNVVEPGTDATKWAVDEAFSLGALEATLAESLAGSIGTRIITPRRLASSVQQGKWNYAVAGGTPNALTGALSPAPANLAAVLGAPVKIKVGGSPNSGAMTLNLNGLGVGPVVTPNNAPLVGGEVPANSTPTFVYDGTNFVLQSVALPANAAGLLANDGNGALSWLSPGGIIKPAALLADQRAAGSTGGALTTNAWVTRQLNIDLYASSGVFNLAGNKFTMLKNGFCQFQSVAYACGRYKHRIYNETDNVAAGYSTPGYTGNTSNIDTQTSANGSCSLIAGKTYRLDTWAQLGGPNGGGLDNLDGSPQVFSTVEIYVTQ